MQVKWHTVHLQMFYNAKWKSSILQMKHVIRHFSAKWIIIMFVSHFSHTIVAGHIP